jgi:hypothetical protein
VVRPVPHLCGRSGTASQEAWILVHSLCARHGGRSNMAGPEPACLSKGSQNKDSPIMGAPVRHSWSALFSGYLWSNKNVIKWCMCSKFHFRIIQISANNYFLEDYLVKLWNKNILSPKLLPCPSPPTRRVESIKAHLPLNAFDLPLYSPPLEKQWVTTPSHIVCIEMNRHKKQPYTE